MSEECGCTAKVVCRGRYDYIFKALTAEQAAHGETKKERQRMNSVTNGLCAAADSAREGADMLSKQCAVECAAKHDARTERDAAKKIVQKVYAERIFRSKIKRLCKSAGIELE